MLLSYLLKCGCCGGGFSKVSQDHYGCSTARNKGTCDNRLTVRQEELEGMVHRRPAIAPDGPGPARRILRGIHRHLNRLRGEQERLARQRKSELAKLDAEPATT